MTATTYSFFPFEPVLQPPYHPDFYYQPTVMHNGDQFASRTPVQQETPEHDNLSWWPATDEWLPLDSHDCYMATSVTEPEVQQLPSPHHHCQDEYHDRRGSTASIGEVDSGGPLPSAEPERPSLRRQPSSSSTTTTGSSSRPHECGYCSRTFARRHDLERHTRLHTGIKPYVCPCCLKAFSRSDARGRHFRNETSCQAHPQVLAWMKKSIRNTI